MKHASSRQVFEYWNERRGRRLAPERGEIEPGPIRRALGDTFILGEDAQGVFRFRLAGTRTCALFCREMKGTDFADLWAASERPHLLALIKSANDDAAGFVAGVTGRTATSAAAELELLLLPLRHSDRTQMRLLGVLAPLVPPYWLGTTPVESLSCGAVRHFGPANRLVSAPRLVPGAENGRVRRGLTVFDGGRS